MTQGEKDLAEIMSVVLEACAKQGKVNLDLLRVLGRLQTQGRIGESELDAFVASSQSMLSSLNEALKLFKEVVGRDN